MTTGELDPHADAAPPRVSDEHATEEDAHAADAHGVGDHAETPPGPVDWGAWLVSGIGVGAAAVMAIVLMISIQHG